MKISQDDLLDALRAALATASDEEAFTATELADMSGLHIEKVRKGLRGLKAQDRLAVVKVIRTYVDGRPGVVCGYRIKLKGAT